jgi:predicted nucleotidyltransferase
VDIESIKSKLQPILESHHAKRAILFGSFARSTDDNRSDIDLIIVDEEKLPYMKRLDKYFKDISTALERPVDLFVYSPSEFEDMKEGFFVERAVSEGVTIYER